MIFLSHSIDDGSTLEIMICTNLFIAIIAFSNSWIILITRSNELVRRTFRSSTIHLASVDSIDLSLLGSCTSGSGELCLKTVETCMVINSLIVTLPSPTAPESKSSSNSTSCRHRLHHHVPALHECHDCCWN